MVFSFVRPSRCAVLLVASFLAACGGSDPTPTTMPPAREQPVSPPVPSRPPFSLVHSAGPGVTVYPTRLEIPGLNRTRGLRIYTPPGYATSTKRYPVVYMHDAQNLFDDATSQAGEVNVDETMDELARTGQLEAIVVGVDRSGEVGFLWEHPGRMTELNPWDSQYGKGEGVEFTDFIVKVVKPLIDREYRTLPDRENTAMMGGSLAGLIAHYAIIKYPEVFSKAGIYSPSYWITPNAAWQLYSAKPPREDLRMYFLVGGNEGGTMVADTRMTYNAIVASGHPAANISLRVAPDGEHGEALYRAEIKAGMLWMFRKTP